MFVKHPLEDIDRQMRTIHQPLIFREIRRGSLLKTTFARIWSDRHTDVCNLTLSHVILETFGTENQERAGNLILRILAKIGENKDPYNGLLHTLLSQRTMK